MFIEYLKNKSDKVSLFIILGRYKVYRIYWIFGGIVIAEFRGVLLEINIMRVRFYFRFYLFFLINKRNVGVFIFLRCIEGFVNY